MCHPNYYDHAGVNSINQRIRKTAEQGSSNAAFDFRRSYWETDDSPSGAVDFVKELQAEAVLFAVIPCHGVIKLPSGDIEEFDPHL
jgi:hypothetical protein